MVQRSGGGMGVGAIPPPFAFQDLLGVWWKATNFAQVSDLSSSSMDALNWLDSKSQQTATCFSFFFCLQLQWAFAITLLIVSLSLNNFKKCFVSIYTQIKRSDSPVAHPEPCSPALPTAKSLLQLGYGNLCLVLQLFDFLTLRFTVPSFQVPCKPLFIRLGHLFSLKLYFLECYYSSSMLYICPCFFFMLVSPYVHRLYFSIVCKLYKKRSHIAVLDSSLPCMIVTFV